jgi:hypothetical protein
MHARRNNGIQQQLRLPIHFSVQNDSTFKVPGMPSVSILKVEGPFSIKLLQSTAMPILSIAPPKLCS